MAKQGLIFNPGVPQGNDPSYIGYSRETGGDKSLATLFSGVSSLFGEGIKAYDEDQQEKIKGELSTGVEGVNQDIMSVLGTNEDAENQDDTYSSPAVEPETPDATSEEFGGETNAATLNATPDGGVAVGDAQRLTKAVKDGKITPEHYWARMEVLSKKLKARYPGYSQVIDRQFQGITGAIPANAYANAQRKAYNATLTQATTEEKEWRSYVRQNQEYLQPDYYARIQEGNPYTQLEVQERVRQLKARDYQFKYEENNFNKEVREGNANKEDAIGKASNKTQVYIDQLMADGFSAYPKLSELLTKAQKDAKSLSPDEKAQLTQGFAELRFKAEQGINKILSETWDDGKTTYRSMISDPGKIKGVTDGALARIDSLQKLINDNDFGIVNSVANYNKATMDDAKRKILESHKYWALVNAAKDLGGGELLNSMLLEHDWNKIKSEAGRAFLDINLMKTVTGDSTSTTETLKKMRDEATSVGVNANEQKTMFRKEIDNKIAILQSDSSPTESWQAAATSLYGGKNLNFLSSVNSASRHDIYMKMTSPSVTKRMQELGKTDPSVYAQYTNWAKKSFGDLFKDLGAGVQEGVVFRENIDVEYDTNSNHFQIRTTKQGANRAAELLSGSDSLVGGFIKGMEDGLEDSSVKSVEKLNRQIDNIKPILEAEGKDVNEELGKLLKGMGINTEAPKAKTFFQKARSAILNAIGQDTPATGPHDPAKPKKPMPGDDKESALKTFSQYARIHQDGARGGTDATAFLTRVRADGNENVEGLDQEFSGRLATMLQDAPEEVRDAVKVDSGYRSVDHQRKLWNAALTKYGSVRAARRWVAPPGHSYHGKGLAVDLKYASPEAREWIRDNAKKYGLHFPLANENWHIEMRGSRKPKRRRTERRGIDA